MEQRVTASSEAMRVVTLCYRYAYLRERRNTGDRLQGAERAIWDALKLTLEGDPQGRRRHRRTAVALPARLKCGTFNHGATVVDISGAGMFIQAPPAAVGGSVDVGRTVQVHLGQPGGSRYIFSCRVERHDPSRHGVGLSFSGAPLELRAPR